MGQNVCLHLPLVSTQLSGRDSHARAHTGDAAPFYMCEDIAMSDFGAVCGKWCALFHVHISFFRNLLPSTTPFLTLSASTEPENIGYLMVCSGNGTVAAKLYLEDPMVGMTDSCVHLLVYFPGASGGCPLLCG